MMVPSRRSIIGLFLNGISLISMLTIAAAVVKRHMHDTEVPLESEQRGRPSATATPPKGASVSLSSVDFRKNGTTVLLLVMNGCVWNRNVADFYGEIMAAGGSTFRPIAVLPQPVHEARPYLRALGLPDSDVMQVDPTTIGVKIVPAILVLDDHGKVRNSWAGALLSEQEKGEVREALGLAPKRREALAGSHAESAVAAVALITSKDLGALAQTAFVQVVDIRSREAQAVSRMSQSVSMPLDEVMMRALHELTPREPLVAICGPCPICDSDDPRRLESLCVKGYGQLKKLGFTDIKMLPENPDAIAAAGITDRSATDRR
jgi:hypothetical protein